MGRKPPAIPTELQSQLGEVEHAFGPNARVRNLATILGLILTATGVLCLAFEVAGAIPGGKGENAFIAFMLVLGLAVAFGSRTMPMNWIFVCDRGLARTRGSAWDAVEWDGIDRFEDASMTHRQVSIRQSRIILNDGSEWGFVSDHIAEYKWLTEMLKQKIDAKSA